MTNPLKNFFHNLSSKEDSVLGIDVSSSSIKVVQLRNKKGRAVLETYGEIALGPYAGSDVGHATSLAPDKIAEALSDVLRESKTTTVNAGLAIPYSSSLISLIEMPAVGEKKLKEMIPLEARKFIPVPISEVMLDWWIIPSDAYASDSDDSEGSVTEDGKPKKVEVLVVAIHKDTINRFQKVVDATGINASFFEIEVFSTVRAALHGESAPILICDVGADTTKIFIIERRILRDTHIINKGSQHITASIAQSLTISERKAEEMKRQIGLQESPEGQSIINASGVVLDGILSEAKRVLLNYEKKYSTSISKVILTGGGSILKGFAEKASEEFETDVELANPFSKIETPAFLEDVLRNAGPEFTVAIGVALRKLDEMS